MTFLEMSFAGAVMITMVAIIRLALINRLPKQTFVILWSLAALRLLVPFQIDSAWSLYSLPPVAHLTESLKIAYDERFPERETDKVGKFATKTGENIKKLIAGQIGQAYLADDPVGQTGWDGSATGRSGQSELLNSAGQAGFIADMDAGGMGNISGGSDGNPKQSMTGQNGQSDQAQQSQYDGQSEQTDQGRYNGQSDQPDQSQHPTLSDRAALPAGKRLPGQAFPWSAVWLAGCLLCAGWYAYNYFQYRRWFAASLPVEDEYVKKWLARRGLRRLIQVRQIAGLGTPLTYGILHPTILLPKRMDWDNKQQLEYVLTHEYVHIRRLDAAAKLVWIAALCLHWFNPFVWLMYVLCNRDLELACDEAVVRIFGEESRAGYARALIGMEETKSGLRPLYNGFSQNATEERITAIMKTRKLTIFAVIIAVLLVAGVTVVFATSGRKAKEAENTREDLLAEKGTAQNHTEELEQEMQDLTRTEQKLAQTKEQWDQEKTRAEHLKNVYINEEIVMAQNHMEQLEQEMQDLTRTEQELAQIKEQLDQEKTRIEHWKWVSGLPDASMNVKVEGISEEKPAKQIRGEGYSILFPAEQDGWQIESPAELKNTYNEAVEMRIEWLDPSLDLAAAEAELQKDGFALKPEGVYEKRRMRIISGEYKVQRVRLLEDDYRVCAVRYSFPDTPEGEEGFGARLEAYADTFALESQNLSEDGKKLKEAVKELQNAEVLFASAKPLRICMGDCDDVPEGGTASVEVECRNPIEGEGNIFLNLEFIKEKGEFRMTSCEWEM